MEYPNPNMNQGLTTPTNPDDLNELGYRIPFGRRFGASFIDALFYIVIIMITVFSSGLIEIMDKYSIEQLQDPNFIATVPEIANMEFWVTISNYVCIGFILLPQALFGITIGKLLFSIKIANEDRTEADAKTLFLRFSVKHAWIYFLLLNNVTGLTIFGILELIFFFVLIVESLVATGVKAQAGHDIIAKTAVYHKNDILPPHQHSFA